MLSRIRRTCLLLATAATIGCGEAPPSEPIRPPAGGGAMIRLPGNRGFVTIKTEGPAATRGRSKQEPNRSIVAAFYQPDGITPMSPAPTDVVLKLGAEGEARPVALTADPKDPSRFASAPGPYPQGLQGMVRLKIGGEDVEESFSAL